MLFVPASQAARRKGAVMKPSPTVQTRRPTAPRIRPATAHDLDTLDGIYAHARRFMAQTGNPTQWGSNEPSREELAASINAGTLFVGTNENNAPCSAFVLIATPEPTYQHIYDGSWPSDEPYLTLHRVASDGTAHGVLQEAVAFATSRARALGVNNLRIDTHPNNVVMQHVIARAGFVRCGMVAMADGSPRIAYQLVLG